MPEDAGCSLRRRAAEIRATRSPAPKPTAARGKQHTGRKRDAPSSHYGPAVSLLCPLLAMPNMKPAGNKRPQGPVQCHKAVDLELRDSTCITGAYSSKTMTQ